MLFSRHMVWKGLLKPLVWLGALGWVWALAMPCASLGAQANFIPPEEISLENITELEMTGATAADFSALLDTALLRKALGGEEDMLGELLLAILAENVQVEIGEERLNPRSTEMRKLIERFAEHQYLVYQPKTPDAVKFAIYLCEGRFTYIYSRLRYRAFFWPLAVLVGAFVLFLLAQLVGWISWLGQQSFRRYLFIGLGLVVLLAVAFALTCTSCISSDSIYGVPF